MAEQEIEIKTAISTIDEDTIKAIKEKSVFNFPNNPSAAGKTPQQIKEAFTKPILDSSESVIGEINRVVGETNAALEAVEATVTAERAQREAAVSEERAQREAAVSALAAQAEARESAHDAEELNYRNAVASELSTCLKTSSSAAPVLYGQEGSAVKQYPLSQSGGKHTVPKGDENGYLHASAPAYNKVAHQSTDASVLVNCKLLFDVLNKTDRPRLDALETAVQGVSRSFVIEDLDALEELVNDEREDFDVFELVSGDNILLVQKDAPDFWFEKLADGETIDEVPTYTHVVYDDRGNETSRKTYSLLIAVDNWQLGVLHVLESDYSLIEGKAISAGKAAEEAKASAEEAKAAADGVRESVDDVSNSLKAYVKKTDYGSQSKAGIVQTNNAYGIYGNPETGLLSVVSATKVQIDGKKNSYMPIAPNMLDYAVKVGLTTNNETLSEEEREAAQRWLGVWWRLERLERATGIKESQFITVEGANETVAVPEGVLPFAQIAEVHGAVSSYLEQGAEASVAVINYPSLIRSDDGRVLFEISDAVASALTDFGIHEGNYVSFEDGRAFYRREYRSGRYGGSDLQEGETYVTGVYDTLGVYRLANPEKTDITERLGGFDGAVNVEGVKSITVVMRHSREDVDALDRNGDSDWFMGKTKFIFEI